MQRNISVEAQGSDLKDRTGPMSGDLLRAPSRICVEFVRSRKPAESLPLSAVSATGCESVLMMLVEGRSNRPDAVRNDPQSSHVSRVRASMAIRPNHACCSSESWSRSATRPRRPPQSSAYAGRDPARGQRGSGDAPPGPRSQIKFRSGCPRRRRPGRTRPSPTP